MGAKVNNHVLFCDGKFNEVSVCGDRPKSGKRMKVSNVRPVLWVWVLFVVNV